MHYQCVLDAEEANNSNNWINGNKDCGKTMIKTVEPGNKIPITSITNTIKLLY